MIAPSRAVKGELVNLFRDPTDNVSSQPKIKRGPNRGQSRKERGGYWAFTSSSLWTARTSERYAQHMWCEALVALGFRIGIHNYEEVTNYYIWVPDGECA